MAGSSSPGVLLKGKGGNSPSLSSPQSRCLPLRLRHNLTVEEEDADAAAGAAAAQWLASAGMSLSLSLTPLCSPSLFALLA